MCICAVFMANKETNFIVIFDQYRDLQVLIGKIINVFQMIHFWDKKI